MAEQYIEGREIYVGVMGNDASHVCQLGSFP